MGPWWLFISLKKREPSIRWSAMSDELKDIKAAHVKRNREIQAYISHSLTPLEQHCGQAFAVIDKQPICLWL